MHTIINIKKIEYYDIDDTTVYYNIRNIYKLFIIKHRLSSKGQKKKKKFQQKYKVLKYIYTI